MGFAERIRMSNIFGGDTPVGMPDDINPNLSTSRAFSFREAMKQADQRRQIEMMEAQNRMQNQNRIAQIGQAAAQAPPAQPKQPMNVVYNPGMTPYQQAQIGLGRQRLDVSKEGAQARDVNADLSRELTAGLAAQRIGQGDQRIAQADKKIEASAAQHNMTDADKAAATLARQVEVSELGARQREAAARDRETFELSENRRKEAFKLEEDKNKEAAKVREEEREKESQMEAMRGMADESISAIDEIIDPDGKIKPQFKAAVGGSRLFSKAAEWIPGIGASYTGAEAKLQKAIKQQVFNYIQQMKAMTGSTGLGPIAVKEFSALEAAASALDPWGDESTFGSEMKKIKDKLSTFAKRPEKKAVAPVNSRAATLLQKYSKPAAGTGVN